MTGRHGGSDDPHRRFHAWLLAAGDGDPPRDLALHASVCAECAAEIGVFDLLTVISTSRAPLPPSRLAPTGRPVGVRLARIGGAAAGVAVVATVAAVGLQSAFHLRLDLPGLGPADTPFQAVLGGTGRPASPSASTNGTAAATPTTPTPSPSHLVTPAATAKPPPPVATAQPRTVAPVTPAARANPTPRPTSTPRPTATPSPSVTPTPTPEPTDTPTPTPTPTQTPTPSSTPAA